jgi:hypothetical protein
VLCLKAATTACLSATSRNADGEGGVMGEVCHVNYERDGSTFPRRG